MRPKRVRSTVVWDSGTEHIICRDERCTVAGVHPKHEINLPKEVIEARRFFFGWAIDPFEHACDRFDPYQPGKTCTGCGAVIPRPKKFRGDGDRRLSQPCSVTVLDECILRALSPHTVKPFRVIYDALLNDYGSCEERRARRRLAWLRDNDRIVYVKFDKVGMIAGYTTNDSPLLSDPLAIEEILWRQQLDTTEDKMRARVGLPYREALSEAA